MGNSLLKWKIIIIYFTTKGLCTINSLNIIFFVVKNFSNLIKYKCVIRYKTWNEF